MAAVGAGVAGDMAAVDIGAVAVMGPMGADIRTGAAEAGEAEEGGTRLGKMQQLQRNRQSAVRRLPKDGLPVACKRYIRRAI